MEDQKEEKRTVDHDSRNEKLNPTCVWVIGLGWVE
jgi:hypothetical protein